MKSQRLGSFIGFILLAAAPQNQAEADSSLTHPQPATANLISLTQFLKAALELTQSHQPPQAIRCAESELVFRLGKPQQIFEERKTK